MNNHKHNLNEICTCGHLGGMSEGGVHLSRIQAGHGKCIMDTCECKQFTWAGWCDEHGSKMTESEEKKRLNNYKSYRGRI